MTHRPAQIDDSGMTVLELLIVLVIMSLITVVATSQIVQQFDRARADVANLQLHQLQGDLELFKIDTNRYPTAEEGLQALLLEPEGLQGWRGPYARGASALVDPWGTDIGYVTPEEEAYALTSLGSDGRAGGTGSAMDISVSP